MPTVTGQSSEQAIPGVFGENTAQGDGVFGQGQGLIPILIALQ
jgi:hypothetical protein